VNLFRISSEEIMCDGRAPVLLVLQTWRSHILTTCMHVHCIEGRNPEALHIQFRATITTIVSSGRPPKKCQKEKQINQLHPIFWSQTEFTSRLHTKERHRVAGSDNIPAKRGSSLRNDAARI
jgi:hypothetical protein